MSDVEASLKEPVHTYEGYWQNLNRSENNFLGIELFPELFVYSVSDKSFNLAMRVLVGRDLAKLSLIVLRLIFFCFIVYFKIFRFKCEQINNSLN